MAKIVTRVVRDGDVEYELRCVSFKVEPVYLSPEHARQVERFTGYPYDAEQEAKLAGYTAFKRWYHKLQVDHAQQRLAQERARLISTLHSVLNRRKAR